MGHSALSHLPYGCMIFFFYNDSWKQCPLRGWLGARPNHLLGSLPLPLPWHPSPFPCAQCSVVYSSSPGHGACAPRDLILSLVLAHAAPHEELGGRVEWDPAGTEAAGWLAEGAWLPSLLLKTTPGVDTAPKGSAGSLPLLWALWCDAVSVYSIQRYLSFPFVNYI